MVIVFRAKAQVLREKAIYEDKAGLILCGYKMEIVRPRMEVVDVLQYPVVAQMGVGYQHQQGIQREVQQETRSFVVAF